MVISIVRELIDISFERNCIERHFATDDYVLVLWIIDLNFIEFFPFVHFATFSCTN